VRQLEVIASLAALAVLVGYGQTVAAQSVPAEAPAPELELLPPGPLPGKRVRGDFRVPGVGLIRHAQRLAIAGSGPRRTALLIARGARGELCLAGDVGERRPRALFTCMRRWDRPPLLVRAGVGGRSRTEAEWISLVGLVRPEVRRVTVESQVGDISHPRLLAWRGFPWKAYGVRPAFRSRLPSHVWAEDAAGKAVQDVDLGWLYGAACGQQNAPPCTRRRRRAGEWATVRDPTTRSQTDFIKRSGGVRAKRLVFDHPVVRRLVAGQAFSTDPVAEWSRCNGKRIGAVVSIRLVKPVSFEGDVPVYANDDSDRSAYLEGVAHIRVENALAWDVYVDLNRRRVVAIYVEPSPFDPRGGKESPPKVEFQLIQPLHPAGGPDSGNCGKQRD
jgi:hypothetical protein